MKTKIPKLRVMFSTFIFATLWVVTPQFAAAQLQKPPADVVFIIDESGSMGDDIQDVINNVDFIANALSASLDPLYGLVGFGANSSHTISFGGPSDGEPHTHADISNLATFQAALNQLVASGGFEPGVRATTYAMTQLTGYRQGAGVCVVLITDEDSDGGDLNTALTALNNRNAVWFGIGVPGVGNTNATYGVLASQTGGALFNISAFRNDPQPVLDALLNQCIVAILQGINLLPKEDVNPLNTNHTVTAIVKDNLAQPVVGAQVTFTVISGPNNGETGTGATDSNGEATFTYTGSGGDGEDTIEACFNDQNNVQQCDTVVKLWDGTPPVCGEIIITGPPNTTVATTVQDTGSGIKSITENVAENVTTGGDSFTEGETQPINLFAQKIDDNQSARIEWRIEDRAGNVAFCDPILQLIVREKGKPVTETVEIPFEERYVTVQNGDPGVSKLDVVVNGQKFKFNGLSDGEERTLDVGSALFEDGDNIVELTARGKPGGKVTVIISNVVP